MSGPTEAAEAEIEAIAEAIFTVDQPKSKWAEFNRPGWFVRDRYIKMAVAAARARVRANANDLENDARCTARAAACKTPIEIIEEKSDTRK